MVEHPNGGGWIKLWRQLRANPWLRDVVQRSVFVTLLLDAETDERERRWGRDVFKLGRGQAMLSERELATELDVGRQVIRRALANLEKGGLISRFSNPRYTIISICNFNRFQSTQPTDQPSDQPADQPNSKKIRRKEEDISDSSLRSESSPRLSAGGTMDFQAWWSCWTIPGTKREPRRARGIYERLVRSGTVDHATLCVGVERYMTWCRARGDPPDKIKHPSTWLNAGCWDEELPTPRRPGNGHDHEPRRETVLERYQRRADQRAAESYRHAGADAGEARPPAWVTDG